MLRHVTEEHAVQAFSAEAFGQGTLRVAQNPVSPVVELDIRLRRYQT